MPHGDYSKNVFYGTGLRCRIKHVQWLCMVAHSASCWSPGMQASSKLCSGNYVAFSLLPAVLTVSHYILHPLLGSLPPRLVCTHDGDLSWSSGVGQSVSEGSSNSGSMQKRSLTTGGQTWKFQNLNGKGASMGISLLFAVLHGRLSSFQRGALTTPLTPSLVPTTFSRFQQEKPPTLSSSHTNQPSQIHSLWWCFFGPYVEFQLLHYFAYSTNFTSNILPN